MKARFFLAGLLLPAASFLHAQSWTSHNTGVTGNIYSISFPAADTGYALNENGIMRKTVNGAASWNTVTAPANALAVYFITGNYGFIVADSVVYKTTNGGTSWTRILGDPNMVFSAIRFADMNTGYLAGINFYSTSDSVRIYKTTNGGTTWSLLRKDLEYYLFPTLATIGSNEVYYSHNSRIEHSTNGGASFTNVYTDTTQSDDIVNFDIPNPDTVYAIESVSVLKSMNAGSNWTQLPGAGSIMYDSYFQNGKTGFVCGGDGFSAGWVAMTTDAGASWNLVYPSPYTFFCMDFPSDSVGYVGGENGTVLKYGSASTSGIMENAPEKLSLYPDPANMFFQVETGITSGTYSLEISDAQGHIIQKSENLCGPRCTASTAALADGVYLVRIIAEHNILTSRLVVQH